MIFMSRIAKQPITIPPKTEVAVKDGSLVVSGPLGSVSRPLHTLVKVEINAGAVSVAPQNSSKLSRALSGTFASHIKNMIAGVNAKYEKKLEIQGVGYKVELVGKTLKFALGLSHPVVVPIPDAVAVAVEKAVITVSGISKEVVGQFAASIRALKKPEPYKGKGIRYQGEYVREKQGKKAV